MPRAHQTSAACQDVVDIWKFIARGNIMGADAFVTALESTFDRLAEMPQLGCDRSDLGHGVRMYVYKSINRRRKASAF
jgi:plasmid stabilization system protein ParE